MSTYQVVKLGVVLIFVMFFVAIIPINSNAWSNGGYSDDPDNPDYGTHDWIAEHALDYLQMNEKKYIIDNLNNYLYGTELPDNPEGYGDTTKHHVYYRSNGTLQDNASAVRAEEEYQKALTNIVQKNFEMASEYAGTMSHYISDVGVFGHVMGAYTDWGAEKHHSDYEDYVKERTTSYTSSEFDKFLSFNGELKNISAYQATLDLAYDTTFDVDGDYDCLWMDADPAGPPPSDSIVVNEFESNPSGTDSGNEWVELYNPTSSSIDLSNWKLKNNDGDIHSLSSSINANGYMVITFSTQWLDNSDERVILINPTSQEIDSTPVKADSNDDDRSWQRSINGLDTNSDSDWSFKTSTKGTSNSRCGTRAYDWNDQNFKDRCGESLNLAVNLIADVLHTLAWEANYVVPEVLNKPPKANIIANITEGYAPLSVSFKGTGIDDDGEIVGYYWDFDDGYISPDQNPTHIFQNPGKYNVTLDVRDDNGDSGIDKILIKVLHKDDKKEINQLPNATIIVNVTNGPAPLSVSFKGVGTDLDGTIISYLWEFGDGNTSNRQELNHTFQNSGEYLVNLTVTDDKRASAFDTILIRVFESPNKSPIAQIIANETIGFEPFTITFHGSGIDNDGYIVSYYWDFDDGETSDEQNPTHTFQTARIYNVTLTIRDDRGGMGNDTIIISVNESYNLPPIPTIMTSLGITKGYAPWIVYFIGGGVDFDGTIESYFWDFDDSIDVNNDGIYINDIEATGKSVSHEFTEPGVYRVTLTVIDNEGLDGSETITITVLEMPGTNEIINDTDEGDGEDGDGDWWSTGLICCSISSIVLFGILILIYLNVKKRKFK